MRAAFGLLLGLLCAVPAHAVTPAEIESIVRNSLRSPEELTEALGRPLSASSAFVFPGIRIVAYTVADTSNDIARRIGGAINRLIEGWDEELLVNIVGSQPVALLIVADPNYFRMERPGRTAMLTEQVMLDDDLAADIADRSLRSTCSGGVYPDDEGYAEFAYFIVDTVERSERDVEGCINVKLPEALGFRIPPELVHDHEPEVVLAIAAAGVNAIYQCATPDELTRTRNELFDDAATEPLPDADCVVHETLRRLATSE